MAGIGGSFFLAYVIEATWLAERFQSGSRPEFLLGVITGLAVCGLFGVAVALILSEHSSLHNQGFNLWLSAISLGSLGLLVALQPVITHFWLHGDPEEDSD
jgi:hypothetical protein